jgi:hypothetical protein
MTDKLCTYCLMPGHRASHCPRREAEDAARWQWIAEYGRMGYEGPPSYRIVVAVPSFDSSNETETLAQAVDRAMAEGVTR